MPLYSLIEHKLRQYMFLGHEKSMYVPPPIRNTFWDEQQKHYENFTGVRIIGNIVNRNKTQEINSIVPIILKIKQEGNLHDDRLLIFALAICAKFNKTQCVKMVADAYAAVSLICTDGLKLLMFVKFCQDVNTILYEKGYIPYKTSGFGKLFCRTIKKWYQQRDPFETTKLLLKDRCFEGLTHRELMYLIHINSKDPGHKIFITYTIYGIQELKELYGPNGIELNDIHDNDKIEELKSIYEYIERIHNIPKMDEISLQNEIELHKWGQQHKIIPNEMLKYPGILTSLIKHMPLITLLNKTYSFAKLRLFHNSTPHTGLTEYISRFTNTQELKESRIHPIESFVEYVKYSRMSKHILTLQHRVVQKDLNCNIHDSSDKLKVLIKANKTNNICETTNEIEMTEEVKQEKQYENNDIQNQSIGLLMLKPLPRLVDELSTFLSEDLIRKTLQNLVPSNRRILILYDSQVGTKSKKCFYTNLLSVHEAITMIILSLIYPETLENKPKILTIKNKFLTEKKIDYNQSLTFSYLESVLYKQTSYYLDDEDTLNFKSFINWARRYSQNYDVFVLLGTNKMNLRNIKKAIKNYQQFCQNSVKIIVCCLNGKHVEQNNLIGNNQLFIAGFDKYIGKVIDGFIKEDF
ncbi:TROVE domain [Cinara cedri]|uniref:TROVE domain n=1 Tax=Cinara cedri TaxID=506608 RepID=A0A5E4MMS1_9HEMI|nr:TROVE domain [Cinara cedri]